MLVRFLVAILVMAVHGAAVLADVPPRKGSCTAGDESGLTLAAVAIGAAALTALRTFRSSPVGRP